VAPNELLVDHRWQQGEGLGQENTIAPIGGNWPAPERLSVMSTFHFTNVHDDGDQMIDAVHDLL
jgi:hypothetical protein